MENFEYLGEFHGLLVFVTALIILYTDHKGFQYFTGQVKTLSTSFVTWSHRIVWIGLISIIITGLTLFIPTWEYLLSEPIFFLKIGFVLLLLFNAIAIGKLSRRASETPFKQLSRDEQQALLVSGGLSTIGWVNAIVIGAFFL